MEETLIELKNKISEAVDLYNKIANSQNQIDLSYADTEDVSESFVCRYGNNHFGVFERYDMVDVNKRDNPTIGAIFYSEDSCLVGCYNFLNKNWGSLGEEVYEDDEESYTIDLEMDLAIPFETIRMEMFTEGIIGHYTIGHATNNEILDVLKYASEKYREEDQKLVRKSNYC